MKKPKAELWAARSVAIATVKNGENRRQHRADPPNDKRINEHRAHRGESTVNRYNGSSQAPTWELTDKRSRSMSGVDLQGDRLVRFVYVDESGIAAREPVALVAGVIINVDSQWKAVEKHISELIVDYAPAVITLERSGRGSVLRIETRECFDSRRVAIPKD